jgi:hypothetical protein
VKVLLNSGLARDHAPAINGQREAPRLVFEVTVSQRAQFVKYLSRGKLMAVMLVKAG